MAQFKDIINFPVSGGMNLDDESRSIPKGDVIRVLNGRWGVSYGSNSNAIEKIMGMQQVNINLPEGENVVRAYVEDTARKAGVFAIYNSTGKHCICRLNSINNSIDVICWELNVLNFPNKYFDMDIVNNGEEGILVWTDGVTFQKELDIKEAREFTNIKYGEGVGYWIIESDNVVQ